MFNFIKKIKQASGLEAIERRHLGQYSHKTHFIKNESDSECRYSDPMRLNTDIWLNIYETNSATICIEDRFLKIEYYLKTPDLLFATDTNSIYPIINIQNNISGYIIIDAESITVSPMTDNLWTMYSNI